jgi:hypothetical protein
VLFYCVNDARLAVSRTENDQWIPAMGMDQKITFPPEKLPTWSALCESMAQKNCPLQMRMIDGDLAFPDEQPPDTWRELRVATAAGMITLRREPDGITFVIWGNADEKLRRDCDTLALAFAELTKESRAE